MGKEIENHQNSDEKKPFLIISDNLARVNTELATEIDLQDLVDQCSRSSKLWFKFTYELFEEKKTIHPRKFIETRTMDQEERDEFVNRTAQELLWAENIQIAIINPDKKDSGHYY